MPSSFFSTPEDHLDPRIFDGEHLRPEIRQSILAVLYEWMSQHFTGAPEWTNVWLAGSGVSYQWSAARDPGDLDCLIGVDFVLFREDNPQYAGLGDDEIASYVNQLMYEQLWPDTANWHGYELTFYINPDSQDIRNIQPYAAYDLLSDSWTVKPTQEAPARDRNLDMRADVDHAMVLKIVQRYSEYLTQLQETTNPAYRINAERALDDVVEQATSLYDMIHEGRKTSFSRTGGGYRSEGNYRWQAGKERGSVQALKTIKEWGQRRRASREVETYGLELRDPDVLITRAMTEYF